MFNEVSPIKLQNAVQALSDHLLTTLLTGKSLIQFTEVFIKDVRKVLTSLIERCN